MGIVLSGALSDGAAGLAELAAAGGTALVQEPEDAYVPSMPEAALTTTPQARRLRADDLGEAIAAFAEALPTIEEEELAVAGDDLGDSPIERSRHTPAGPPTGYTCPECHGPLWEVGQNRFRCRVGHVYNEDHLVHAKDDEVEAALWAALEALEERAELMERIARRLRAGGSHGPATRYRERRNDTLRRAELLRTRLLAGEEPTEASAG
jgi:two-component system chemotaxis response regulator CheB